MDKRLFVEPVSWTEMLERILTRSEREMRAHGLCDIRFIHQAHDEIQKHRDYFEVVEQVPFLYDLNVRNVLVEHGKVTGVIDVDDVWLGDPLLSIGRGKTILLAMNQDTDRSGAGSSN